MSKYIDKDELWERLRKHIVHHVCTNTLFNTIKAVIDGMPTIEVSEDCISREEVRAKLDYISYAEKDPISIAKRIVDIAPSVVPTVWENRTVEQSCDTCRHNKLEWDSKECDGCTKANSKYEPTTEQSSMVYECPYCKYKVELSYCPNCGANRF